MMKIQRLILKTAIVAAAIWLAWPPKAPLPMNKSETQKSSDVEDVELPSMTPDTPQVTSSKKDLVSTTSEAKNAFIDPQGLHNERTALDFFSLKKRLEKVNACYQTQCPFPSNDPREYDFEVGRALKEVLLAIESNVSERKMSDPEVSGIGRQYLASLDGHVQSAALHLLASQPPSDENFDAIIKYVIAGYDAKLVKQALFELQRYLGTANESRLHPALVRAMVSGAPFVAGRVSDEIAHFLNTTSIDLYRRSLQQLRPGSQARRALQTALREFDRRHHGA